MDDDCCCAQRLWHTRGYVLCHNPHPIFYVAQNDVRSNTNVMAHNNKAATTYTRQWYETCMTSNCYRQMNPNKIQDGSLLLSFFWNQQEDMSSLQIPFELATYRDPYDLSYYSWQDEQSIKWPIAVHTHIVASNRQTTCFIHVFARFVLLIVQLTGYPTINHIEQSWSATGNCQARRTNWSIYHDSHPHAWPCSNNGYCYMIWPKSCHEDWLQANIPSPWKSAIDAIEHVTWYLLLIVLTMMNTRTRCS